MATKREGDPGYDKIEMDEPMFTLRAQDSIAPEVVEAWARTLLMRGGARTRVKVEEARKCAQAMRDWQAIHGCKIPD